MSMPPELGIYLHIPFCAQKCFYCDFNSYAGYGPDQRRRYMRALATEVAAYADPGAALAAAQPAPDAQRAPRPVTSIYIGGGTPTLAAPEDLADLLDQIRALYPVAPEAEISCEANPASATVATLTILRAAGVNRLSIGAQAFQDRLLQRLGRAHDVAAIRRTVLDARRAGFDDLNIDLMFGLPGQTRRDWEATLDRALELAPEHISAYSLIVEEGTPFMAEFRAGQLELPAEEDEEAMWHEAVARLTAAGFEHYEISNFARPGRRCRHNLLYWNNGEYYGFGAGAHGRLGLRRYWNLRPLGDYVRRLESGQLPVESGEDVDPALDRADTLMLGLRRTDGIRRADFRARFGIELDRAYPGVVERLRGAGLLADDGERIALTGRGMRLGNQVWMAFLKERTAHGVA